MTLQKPVRLLMEYARPEILTTHRPDSCIASTAVGIRVLERFGIGAWPVPVHAVAMNAQYVAMMNEVATNKEENPDAEMPEEAQRQWMERGAWSVELSNLPSRADGFDGGHLVIGIKDHLVDLSIDQASRPHKGIPLEPLAIDCPQSFYEGERIWRHVGTAILVYRHAPFTGFLEQLMFSGDWTNKDGRLDNHIRRTEAKIRTHLQRRKR